MVSTDASKSGFGLYIVFRESGIPIKTVAYKLSGNEGCLSYNETFSEWTAGQVTFNQKRQHKCSPVYQSSGGYEITKSLRSDVGILQTSHREQYNFESGSILENKNILTDQFSRIKSVQQNEHWRSILWGWFFKFWGNPLIDQFASAENKQIYCTWTPNPNSLALNAMIILLENMFEYVFHLIFWLRGYFNI